MELNPYVKTVVKRPSGGAKNPYVKTVVKWPSGGAKNPYVKTVVKRPSGGAKIPYVKTVAKGVLVGMESNFFCDSIQIHPDFFTRRDDS